ncbi:MXAN_2561 family MXYO-CTERM-anchored protein [Pyxidicoccus xibeiensis]|uniref:MXAN_2561 family MXYO-CTERM-anchored protein n=1 Tax=Pyxidicoccus xibeiensis TaxID=2906759 RepID=UPI0020A70CC4|nr:MXAN_2561 family MXYO-CTERM-anchored protein [Pyxidicoccus xibeiensis]MCP3141294.1 hypothetical protein [Pyxidicoccus xibeiensis]
MRLTFVGLLLFASTALGQTVTFSGTVIQQGDRIVVSKELCSTPRTITWTRSTGTLCDTLYIWISNDTCTGIPGTDDVLLEELSKTSTTTTGTENIVVSDILTRNGSSCDEEEVQRDFKLCATTRLFDSATTTNCRTTAETIGSPSVTVRFDSKAPTIPGAPSVTGLDKALSVTVTPPGDTTTMVVEVRALGTGADGGVEPTGEPVSRKEQSTDNTTFRMENLQNGVEYAVQAIAVDQAGNPSKPSDATLGTPVASFGFYEEYLNDGGAESGGCGAAGGGLAAGALAAFGFWLSSRRKQS